MHKRLALKISLFSLIGLLIFVTLLPIGLQYGLQYWLKKETGLAVTISDIDLNLFTLKGAIKQLTLDEQRPATDTAKEKDKLERFDIDIAGGQLFNKKALISGLNISGLTLAIKQEPTQTELAGFTLLSNGKKEPAEKTSDDKSEKPWQWGLEDVVIGATELRVKKAGQTLVLDIDKLTLDRLHSDEKDSPTRINLKGSIDGSPVSLNGRFQGVGEKFSFDGKVSLGELAVTTLKPWTGELPIVSAVLSADSKLNFRQADQGQFSLTQQGRVDVKNIVYQSAGIKAQMEAISWQGETALDADEQQTINLKGQFAVKQTQVDTADQQLQLSLQGMQTEFNSKIATHDPQASLTYEGVTTFNQLHVFSPQKEVDWLKTEAITLDGLSVESLDSIKLSRLELVNYQLMKTADKEQQRTLLRGDKTVIQDTVIEALTQIKSNTIKSSQMHAELYRGAEGELRVSSLLKMLTSLIETAQEQSTRAPGNAQADDASSQLGESGEGMEKAIKEENQKADTQTKPVRIMVDSITIDEGSSVKFDDSAVKPPFSTSLKLTDFKWRNFDTRADEKGTVNVKATLDKFTKLNIDSDVTLKGNNIDFDAKMDISSLSLPPLSSYSVDASGYALTSGQLDGKVTLQSKHNKLDGELAVDIHKFQISESDSEKVSQGKQSSSDMSLAMALDLLRDKNDHISLTIPISGDLDSPEFDTQQVVNKAIKSAAKKGAMTYLKSTLQPYGALITIAQYANEAASHIRLAPLVFEAGKSSIDSTDRKYLNKVIEVLNERKQIQIKVCGVASESDRTALQNMLFNKQKQDDATLRLEHVKISDEQLRELADTRATSVRQAMVEQYGIDIKRLIACLPSLDEKQEAKPRVELLL